MGHAYNIMLPPPSSLLLGNRVFADVLKMMSYWIKVGPKYHMTGVLLRVKSGHRQKEGHVTTEAGITVLQAQVKEYKGLSATTKD